MATFAPKLAAPASAEDFASELTRVCNGAGFSHYLVMRFNDDALTFLAQVLQNAPDESREQLHKATHWSVARLMDRVRQSPLPFHFSQHDAVGLALPGYHSGVAALARQARGGVMLCFGNDSPELDTSRLVPMMGNVLVYASVCSQGLSTLHVTEECPFTPKELACLEQTLKGLSTKQTAQQLGISPRTVDHHLESVRKRLAAKTTMAAAYLAVQRGWLRMPSGDGQATG